MVYGGGIAGIMSSSFASAASNAMYEEVGYDWDELIQRPGAAAVFEGVGGLAAWLQLQADMPDPKAFAF
jgi:hypothetical protein